MAPKRATPPALDSWLAAVEEVADFRHATPRQHYEGFVAACHLAAAILERHPARAARYETQDPLPSATHLLLARLRTRD